MPEYQKLVRDKIPDIIRDNGQVPVTRVLNKIELINALRAKLVEEAKELQDATARKQIIAEVADVKEAYDALLRALHLLPQEVERAQAKKREKNGGFDLRLYLVEVWQR